MEKTIKKLFKIADRIYETADKVNLPDYGNETPEEALEEIQESTDTDTPLQASHNKAY